MDQLPVEIQEMILNHFLWDKIREIYRLRVVSKAWKFIVDKFMSRLFEVWYSRCKAEIPEDHLTDIVQAKYPLVAHPWQEFYWVDSRLPHVAKNAYDIWKSLPNSDDGFDPTKIDYDIPFGGSPHVALCINDKYLGKTARDEEFGGWVTKIFNRNIYFPMQQYKLMSDQIDLYTTEKGTFVVLSQICRDKWKNYISKYPLNDDEDVSPKLKFLGLGEHYYITQNEYFSNTETDESTHSKIIKHKILTKRGFKTSTVIRPPADMPQYEWSLCRVEICGCTLYVMHKGDEKLSIAKYKISRNSKGKLSFTFEELKILDKNEQENSALYNQLNNIFDCGFSSDDLRLTEYAFATEKFNSWLKDAFNGDIKALAIHANYVICEDQNNDEETHICIFRKDNLIECMEANDPDHLKPALRYDSEMEKEVAWIGIMYNGLKAQIIVYFLDDDIFRYINFF